MAEDTHPAYLSPSELGTKDYWESYYARTLAHISQSPLHDPTAQTAVQSSDSHSAHANANASDSDDDNASINAEDDPGTSWFAEHNAPEKVLRFLTRRSFPLSPHNTLRKHERRRRRRRRRNKGQRTGPQPAILDLGTGNGSMLALLRTRGGFAGPMVGVDYSARSVELARELQRVRGHAAYRGPDGDESGTESESESESGSGSDEGGDEEEEGEDPGPDAAEKEEVVVASPRETAEAARVSVDDAGSSGPDTQIRFEEWDILGSAAVLSDTGTAISPLSAPTTSDARRLLPWFPYEQGGFDIVLDKGTFDAVSLADDAEAARVCERYPDIARRLLRRGGFLVVTSCNWTEEELVRWFTGDAAGQDGDRLVVWGRVEYPRFRFGGVEGQGVCTVCFQRARETV